MSRFAFGLVFLSSLFSFAASGAAQTFMTCSDSASPSQVEIQVSNPYGDSWVRVDVRELKADGSQIRTLNDLSGHPEHAQGIFQNHWFRLIVSPVENDQTGLFPAHIDFLYDSGIRASADLVCQKL